MINRTLLGHPKYILDFISFWKAASIILTGSFGTTAADTAPKDGQVLIREWLNYAAARVPQIQDQAREERELVQQKSKESQKKKEPEELQRPRVFYRRELEPQPMVVAKPPQP